MTQRPFTYIVLVLWSAVAMLAVDAIMAPLPNYASAALSIGLIAGLIYFAGISLIDLWRKLPPTNVTFAMSLENIAEGYVYLLKSSEGMYKIGRSVDPENRRETFTVKLPFRVEYLHLIPCRNRFVAERKLHNLFRHQRV